jgi:hypothetical protein
VGVLHGMPLNGDHGKVVRLGCPGHMVLHSGQDTGGCLGGGLARLTGELCKQAPLAE